MCKDLPVLIFMTKNQFDKKINMLLISIRDKIQLLIPATWHKSFTKIPFIIHLHNSTDV